MQGSDIKSSRDPECIGRWNSMNPSLRPRTVAVILGAIRVDVEAYANIFEPY
jgi:hypothetical protein